MRKHSFGFEAALVLVVAAVLTASGQQRSPGNRPWPPGLQTVSDESPALSPVEALKTFFMPPGYHLELVAAEPLVKDPIAIDWDPDGRMWVVEFSSFVRDLQAPEPNLEPLNRVAVLEDTNNDGVMDRRTVFADGLVQGRAIKVLDRGVLVGEPPNLWLMRDTNGDLKADTKELVSAGYGRREGNVQSNANGLLWAMDNVIYSAGSSYDFALRLKDGKFEKISTLARGEWGVAQDDAGRTYRNTNESAIHADLVPTQYYARNPNLIRTRGSYEALSNDAGNINEVWPVRPNPGTNRAYQFGIDRPDGTLAQFTAVCGPAIYRGDRLPAELYGNAFVAEPAANLVSRLVLEDDGTAIRGRKAYPKGEFLASTDERFRPVNLSSAPDGTLYVVDMYRGIIEGRASTTVYLRDHSIKRKLEQPLEMGRIYRVVHDTTRRGPRPALSRATPAQLVQALSHPNGWWRDTAQRLLVERGARSVVTSLKTLATSAPDPRARLHALWTLDGNDSIDVATVTRALEHRSRDVRLNAVRLAERWLGEATQTSAGGLRPAVLALIDDPDWSVRQQVAASLGALPVGPRETAIASILAKHAADPVVVDAALSGVRGSEAAVLEILLAEPVASPVRETAITMTVATIVQAAQDATVQQVLALAADAARPEWQRGALIRGVEVVLLNAAMPGSGRRGTPTGSAAAGALPGQPCPTCPGGRGGPGGGYAFEDARPSVAPAPPPVTAISLAGGGRGSGGPRLRLTREPAAFSAMAVRGAALSARATALLARLEWPGKPGAAAALPPLSPDEQRRFDAGREVYRNICQACHQPDGRGQDRVAPSLLGSRLALGPADVTARILLNGKEGPVGLMPPLGMTMTDDQIASVLTYVRREWGQPGSPVDPAQVGALRAQTAARTRPWAHDELMAMLPGGGRGGN